MSMPFLSKKELERSRDHLKSRLDLLPFISPKDFHKAHCLAIAEVHIDLLRELHLVNVQLEKYKKWELAG